MLNIGDWLSMEDPKFVIETFAGIGMMSFIHRSAIVTFLTIKRKGQKWKKNYGDVIYILEIHTFVSLIFYQQGKFHTYALIAPKKIQNPLLKMGAGGFLWYNSYTCSSSLSMV